MESIHDILFAMSYKNSGDWNSIYKMLKEKVPITHQDIQEAYSRTDCSCLTITDNGYPENFKSVWKPPLTIFYKGDISLLENRKMLAVVGSREPSQYTAETLIKLIRDVCRLDPGITIVSGLARGVDAIAMRTALDCGARVIGVMGSGLENIYPDTSKDIYDRCASGSGLVISEYPGETPPRKEHFPFRNRLIASLSRCILACQVGEKSGTYITIRYGLDLGKSIALIPQRLEDGEITGQLVRDGALLVSDAYDIVKEVS